MLDASLIRDHLKADRELLFHRPISRSNDDIQFRLALLQSVHDREKLMAEIERMTTVTEIEK